MPRGKKKKIRKIHKGKMRKEGESKQKKKNIFKDLYVVRISD